MCTFILASTYFKFGESVDDMGAEFGIDILNVKAPNPVPFGGPVRHIAHDLRWSAGGINRFVILFTVISKGELLHPFFVLGFGEEF